MGERTRTEKQLHAAVAAVGRTQADLLRALRAHAASSPWLQDDCRDMTQWVALDLGVTHYKAERLLVAADALARLPRLTEALEHGRLALDKVVELARFVTPDDEDHWISWARSASPGAIRSKASQLRHRDDDEAERSESERTLQWWWDDFDRLCLYGVLPAADGAAFVAAIERVAPQLPQSPTLEDCSDPAAAARADALVALARHGLASDADADRATVVAHVDVDALGLTKAALAEGPGLDRSVAERLACDARIQAVAHDRAGAIASVGHTSRVVPPQLRRAVAERDGYRCTFPNCEARRFTEVHHIRHWFEGGRTEPGNLVLICCFHHKLVHEHGWKVRLNAGAAAEWFRPGGERFLPGPEPPLDSELVTGDLRSARLVAV